MREAIGVLRDQGAVIVDPADIPSVVDPDPGSNFVLWNVCRTEAPGANAGCSIAFQYGMKRDFNGWLASLGNSAPLTSLTALREWNSAHARPAP